jgi:hypothetical protein
VRHSEFCTLRATGHFLDMEHKAACRDSQEALLSFLKPAPVAKRPRYTQVQSHHAFAL